LVFQKVFILFIDEIYNFCQFIDFCHFLLII
jgi:hypothetical protein